MSILSVENIGKAYRSYDSELSRFAGWFGLPIKATSEHWILEGISFNVKRGESVGIVGRNGAGKSTLLKMITGTLQPTTGKISVGGSISAILELGMGFNPDLTARANVFHALGLMGHSHESISKVMPEVEAFAEIGEYFNEPMRTYSSGMQMRVAFGVATAFRPDLLIVDEALSVGDGYFQHKSFDKIREFKNLGTSLLLVSHDAQSIQSVCDKVVLLSDGGLLMEGKPDIVMDYYNASLADHQKQTIRQVDFGSQKKQTISGTGEASIESVALLSQDGALLEHVAVGQNVTLSVDVNINEDIKKLVLGFGIKNHLGQVVYGTNTYHTKQIEHDLKAGKSIQYTVNFDANLGPGSYSIQIALVSSETHLENNYEWRDNAYVFKIVNTDKDFFAGMMWLDQKIRITHK